MKYVNLKHLRTAYSDNLLARTSIAVSNSPFCLSVMAASQGNPYALSFRMFDVIQCMLACLPKAARLACL